MWKSMDVIGGLVSLAEGFAFVGALFGAAAVIRRLKTRQHARHIMALMNEQLYGESSRPRKVMNKCETCGEELQEPDSFDRRLNFYGRTWQCPTCSNMFYGSMDSGSNAGWTKGVPEIPAWAVRMK